MDRVSAPRLPADRIQRARRAARSLVAYPRVLADRVGEAFLALLDALAGGEEDEAYRWYHRFAAELLEAAAGDAGPWSVSGAGGERHPGRQLNLWQLHLLERILSDENPFSRTAARGGIGGCPPLLLEAAAEDLCCLQTLFSLDWDGIRREIGEAEGEGVPFGPVGMAAPRLWVEQDGRDELRGAKEQVMGTLAQADDWRRCVADLAAYYARAGTGPMARFSVFRWERRGGAGRLHGVTRPDPVRLGDLIGYRSEREVVVRNTLQFLEGLPANHVLLYGDRGTGKSATVKAIANEFAHRGLRLVELPRPYLADLPELLSHLHGRPQRFIVFIDDLSFEEEETDYKHLKVILEGSVQVPPDNVRVYATSNRRHLVRERFSDRGEGSGDDLRREDTVQEKLSLSDRFGLTVVFPSADQRVYLEIVEGLAAREGLAIPREELRREALRWVLWHNDRSPRTARQFIDDLKGRLQLEADPDLFL